MSARRPSTAGSAPSAVSSPSIWATAKSSTAPRRPAWPRTARHPRSWPALARGAPMEPHLKSRIAMVSLPTAISAGREPGTAEETGGIGAGSMLTLGGSGRLWVRGQSCKLTGCVKVHHGESFPPEARGPRARGKDCHVRWVSFAARPAQPAVPEASGQAPPGRGRVHHPARRPGGHRPGARPAQLGRAEAGLRPGIRAGKPRPGPSALGDLAFLRRRRAGLDGARLRRAQGAFRRSLPGRDPGPHPGRASQQDGRGPACGTCRPQPAPA